MKHEISDEALAAFWKSIPVRAISESIDAQILAAVKGKFPEDVSAGRTKMLVLAKIAAHVCAEEDMTDASAKLDLIEAGGKPWAEGHIFTATFDRYYSLRLSGHIVKGVKNLFAALAEEA